MARNEDSYTGKKRTRRIRLEREHRSDQGSEASNPPRYHVANPEGGVSPIELILPRKEEIAKPIDGEHELSE